MAESTGLIPLSGGLIEALGSGGIHLNLMPRNILVLECIVAGTSFRGLGKVEHLLKPKLELLAKRESGNEHDSMAVSLWVEESAGAPPPGKKIGYIPRDKNEVIARLMDAGKQFFALVEEAEKEGHWWRLEVTVWMRD